MNLSELMRAYRKENGISQRQLATKTGLTSGYISILERNFNPQTQKPPVPSIPVLSKLAAGMDMTLNQLFEEVEDIAISVGESLEPTPEDSQPDLKGKYSQLTDEHKKLVDYIVEVLVKSQ